VHEVERVNDYTLLDPVRAANGSLDAEALLRQPTHVLIAVSEQAATVLASIDIATVLARGLTTVPRSD
jgi:hypothetical protein